jgi:hypothetical protein
MISVIRLARALASSGLCPPKFMKPAMPHILEKKGDDGVMEKWNDAVMECWLSFLCEIVLPAVVQLLLLQRFYQFDQLVFDFVMMLSQFVKFIGQNKNY